MAGQGKEHNGFKYILSVKDYFTKAAWFRELPDKSGMSANYRSSRMRAVCSGDVLNALEGLMAPYLTIIEVLQSDNGREFKNALFVAFGKRWKIKGLGRG